MCGICGFTGRSNIDVLKKMMNTLVHRGPDEEGFYNNQKINLGIRRLSIIDIETGHQPVHNEDNTINSVFNGEIYNYQSIRKELEEKGHTFYTHHSDSEVLVHLYEEYGESFVHKLNGMFAIALWDENREVLLLARDRMGVKPLFYTQIKNNLIFSSEIKAILSHPQYKKDINFEGIYHFFTFKNVPAPLTSFKNIFTLLPGELLTFHNGRLNRKQWWKVVFKENPLLDETSISNEIIKILEDAVRIRMVSDVPIGAYLSGGIDSSAVVALMTKFSSKPVKTFSLIYDDKIENKKADTYFAQCISKQFKTEHYQYTMTAQELVDNLEEILSSFDQPFSGTISTFFLSQLIKKHVKVALSGDGADELFGSYLSHRIAQPMHRYSLNTHNNNRNISDISWENYCMPQDISIIKNLIKISSDNDLIWRYNLYSFMDNDKEKLFKKSILKKYKYQKTIEFMREHFNDLSSRDPLNRILEYEWNTQLPDQVLSFVDFLSMAHSVEVRSPFLDYRLIEYSATIPGALKIKKGITKYILKKALKNILPQEVIDRPKEGFVLPIYEWLQHELKEYIQRNLSKPHLALHGLFNENEIYKLCSEYSSGRKEYAGKLWSLVVFQIWWEKYFN